MAIFLWKNFLRSCFCFLSTQTLLAVSTGWLQDPMNPLFMSMTSTVCQVQMFCLQVMGSRGRRSVYCLIVILHVLCVFSLKKWATVHSYYVVPRTNQNLLESERHSQVADAKPRKSKQLFVFNEAEKPWDGVGSLTFTRSQLERVHFCCKQECVNFDFQVTSPIPDPAQPLSPSVSVSCRGIRVELLAWAGVLINLSCCFHHLTMELHR